MADSMREDPERPAPADAGPHGTGRRVPPPGPEAAADHIPTRHVLAAIALAAILAAGIVLAFSGGWFDAGQLAEDFGALDAWGPLAMAGSMILHCFVPFPAELLAVAAGAVYGTVMGTAVIWTGAMLGAALSFGLSRWLGRGFVEAVLPARHRAALDEWTADQGAVTLLVSRFIPVIAFNLINYAAGLTRIGWWTFLWTTGIGILPLTILSVMAGSAMRTLSWPWLLALSAIGIGLSLALHGFARRRGWLGRRPGANGPAGRGG